MLSTLKFLHYPEMTNILKSLDDEARIRLNSELSKGDYLADLHNLSIDELTRNLEKFEWKVNREEFRRIAEHFESAEGVKKYLFRNTIVSTQRSYHDDIFPLLVALWERWFPERYSTEQIEFIFNLCENLLDINKNRECCLVCLAVLPRIWELLSKEEWDKDDPCQSFYILFFNWFCFVKDEMWNLGLNDPFFHKGWSQLCINFLAFCPDIDDELTEQVVSELKDAGYEIRV